MAFSPSIYKKAAEEINRRRLEAVNANLTKKEAVFSLIPEIKRLFDELAEFASNFARLTLLPVSPVEFEARSNALKERSLASRKKIRELLVKSGYPEDYLDIKFTCEKCEDTGNYDFERCDCFKKLLSQKAQEVFSSFSSAAGSTFEDFDSKYYPEAAENGVKPREKMQKLLDFCKQYAASFSKSSCNILMHGSTGLGKTHLSLAIANEVIKKGCNVIYASAQNLMLTLEREHFKNGESEEYSLDAVMNCDLLIIDDLGTEFTTQFGQATIYNIINTRLFKKLPTIINTNLGFSEIEAKYTQRVLSRLYGDYTVLALHGKDIRQIKKMGAI